MDTKGSSAEISYPNIFFILDNFEEVRLFLLIVDVYLIMLFYYLTLIGPEVKHLKLFLEGQVIITIKGLRA